MLADTPRPANNAPILLTGAHRSGTTWTGSMLALAPNTVYIHEPFNINLRPGWSATPFTHWYQHVSEENEATWAKSIDSAVALRYPVIPNLRRVQSTKQSLQLARNVAWSWRQRLRHPRVVVKDPLALLSAEWFAGRYGGPVVITIRHPAGFVSSLDRLGWRFNFQNLATQESLMTGLLAPWRQEIERAAADQPDTFEGAVLLWKVIYGVVADYQDRRPDWLYVRHEDLSMDPTESFRELYSQLGLVFDDEVRKKLTALTKPSNDKDVEVRDFRQIRRDSAATAAVWKQRMPEEQVARIHDALSGVAGRWYEEDTWRL